MDDHQEAAAISTAGAGSVRSLPADDTQLLAELRTLYAGELAYPEDVITDDASFEADLGLDSLGQIAILLEVLNTYGLGKHANGLVGGECPTLASVAALLRALPASP
jgi:[acyl-carrier-protein] S-malonyltransferase